MNIATIKVSGVKAVTNDYPTIPVGIVGATVTFEFTDPAWDGLNKTAVFRGCVTRDVLMTGNVVRIPAETVAQACAFLFVGVYGTDAADNLVIPTLWLSLGTVRDAADPSGDPGTDQDLPIWAQLQDRVEALESGAPSDPDSPGTPGRPGEDGEGGGYYTPAVTQPSSDTVEFSFSPSNPDMPAVDPVQVKLPAGQGSGGNVDEGLRIALANYFTHVMPNFDDTNGLSYINAILTALGASPRVEPDEPEAVLTRISAMYSGGSVPVGTSVTALAGIVVTAHYSDGSSKPVTGYTLSGTIAEGSNTVTVSYGGMTTTFTVNGVADAPEIKTYTVTSGLTNVESTLASAVMNEGDSYTATLTAAEGYELDTVTVTMGGVDITATAYADGVVTIANVTGNVIVTASAVEVSTGENNGWVEGEAYAVEWTDGRKLNNDGTEADDSARALSSFMPCLGVSALTVGSGVNSDYLFAYDADKNYLGRIYHAKAYPCAVNREVAYVRVNCLIANKATATLTPHVYDELGENTAWEDGKYYTISYIPDIEISQDTGNETNKTGWWASGFALCYGATNVELLTYGADVTWFTEKVVFYDADKNYISGTYKSSSSTFAVPENAKYFRVSSRDDFEYTLQLSNRPWVKLS